MSQNGATYANYADVLSELLIGAPVTNEKPDRLAIMERLREATSYIDARLGDKVAFLPSVETVYISALPANNGGPVNGLTLTLPKPLLSLTSLVNGDGSAITSESYTLTPRAGAPYTGIRLTPGSLYWRPDPYGVYDDAIAVTGVWSGSARPLRGGEWLGSNGTLKASMDTSTASITTERIDGANALYGSPRFSPGMRLRIITGGVAEYMDILDTGETSQPTNAQTLTVRRATGGTTAIAHTSGDAISVWRPDLNIVRACARLAAFYYRRAGRFTSSEADLPTGTVNRYGGVPTDVDDILKLYETAKSGPVRFLAVRA